MSEKHFSEKCEKLLAICRENEKEIEERIAEGHKKENAYKTAKAATAVIHTLCDVDELTPRIAEDALKTAGEFIDFVVKNEVMN